MVLTLDISPEMVSEAQSVMGKSTPEDAILAAVEAGIRSAQFANTKNDTMMFMDQARADWGEW